MVKNQTSGTSITSGKLRSAVEHLRVMEMNASENFEAPETQGYLRALQDVEEKFDLN